MGGGWCPVRCCGRLARGGRARNSRSGFCLDSREAADVAERFSWGEFLPLAGASGAISVSDAVDPSPARIAEIQARVATQGIACVLSEPQFNPGIVAAVMEGSDAQTAVLDPLGSDLEPGAALYGQVLRNLAKTIANCL